MELVDPTSGRVVWADNWGIPLPPPRADGKAYIKRGGEVDRTVKPESLNAIAMIGRDTGITPRLNMINQMMNPAVALQEAGRRSQNMFAPDRTGWERVGDLGGMLSGMAGTVAPMVAASRGAIPAADAIMEGVAGYSAMPRAVAGDFLADEFGGLRLPLAGDSLEDALKAKYPGVKISITESPTRGLVLNRIEVPKDLRNQGIGTKVMQDLLVEADRRGSVVALSPSADFGGSVARLKNFYARLGFVPNKGKSADYAISESMYRPQKSPPRLASE